MTKLKRIVKVPASKYPMPKSLWYVKLFSTNLTEKAPKVKPMALAKNRIEYYVYIIPDLSDRYGTSGPSPMSMDPNKMNPTQ